MVDIEERDEELYRARGRVWLEAATELGVSRGALAEAGMYGDTDDMPDELDGTGPGPTTPGASAEREPDFICTRNAPTRTVYKSGSDVGRDDRLKLGALLASDELGSNEREAFEGMTSAIGPGGRFDKLTDRQRAWVDGRIEKLGIHWQDPAAMNANVPRGREVAPAWGGQLPLAPPGRPQIERKPDGRINNCALENGEEEDACQVCRGLCPDKGKRIREEVAKVDGARPATITPPTSPVASGDVELNDAGAVQFRSSADFQARIVAGARALSKMEQGRAVRIIVGGVVLATVTRDVVTGLQPVQAPQGGLFTAAGDPMPAPAAPPARRRRGGG